MLGRHWTEEEIDIFLNLYNFGATVKEIEEKTGHDDAYGRIRILNGLMNKENVEKVKRTLKAYDMSKVWKEKIVAYYQKISKPIGKTDYLKRNSEKTYADIENKLEQKVDVYKGLEEAMKSLQAAIENVVSYEVDRRVGEERGKYNDLLEEIKNSNWVDNLKKKFQSV
ncbi:MAG: hypothetical protein WC549_00335 [Actinomycetota bacterium]